MLTLLSKIVKFFIAEKADRWYTVPEIIKIGNKEAKQVCDKLQSIGSQADMLAGQRTTAFGLMG